MKRNLTTIIQLGAIAFVVAACSGKAESVRQEAIGDTVPVRVISLSKTKVRPTIQVSGQLTTDDETHLAFKTGGVIRSINVKEGDAVRKGQVLATLDLTEIKAQVAQARLGFEKAQRDYNRASRLHKDSVATLEQFQNSQTGLEIARKQLEAAEFNLSFSEIRALTDGFVLRKFVSEGQVISPGAPVLLTNGARQGRWIIRTGVGDREWSAVKLDDEAKVVIDAFPGDEYSATVTRKSEGVDPANGSFSVELSINGKQTRPFAAGMFGKAVITPRLATEMWIIPFDALLDGDANQGYVFVTDDNRVARRVMVGIAGITKEYIQVNSGLDKARFLIVSGSAYLTDGSAIRVSDK